ncbi:putative plant specific eukaryotic initiation factor 4B [Rosa chinensis]|uniref:Putative plant specific eukaryotic initiation factor 4B n=1 Tax=Rosa chinensis TaxID=74649 RepID=A0A2P6R180_ROSCH|nr:eukaryotic translation initiation factor 4B2 [Rosa chinensis]PRQ40194.1 putative plant specific eukaryotic initiation factor 4B [Rosa chinensis]
MSKPWGVIGAWAAEAERAEAEELAAAQAAESQSFPSLKEAVTTKPKSKKMTLSEFTMGSSFSSADSTRLTPDEMLRLPTGPKERSAEEMQYGGRLGGGFSSYGRPGPNPGRGRDREDSDGSWGGGGRRSYGGFEDDRRGPPSRVSDLDLPSRADEVDNWASTKKPIQSFDSGRQNRYASLGGGGGGGGGGVGGGAIGGAFSRADEVDNWATGKRPVQPGPPARSSTFGSGFRDSGPEPDRWARGGGGGGGDGVERERPRLVLDPRRDVGLNEPPAVVKTNKPSPFGAARPREENLADKGLDYKKLDSEIEAKKTSRPSSAHSSRPSSAQSSRSEGPALHGIENVVKPRPKVNPFGDAKPREVLLEERGKDWRKIDQQLEHRSVDRPETEEEKRLKEEIDGLRKELESKNNMHSETVQDSSGSQPSLHDIVLQKERELELLIRDLDDKVRFGQKAIDRPGSGAGRPGSGAGRAGSFLERTPSHSGSFEDSRNMEYMDRPRSHGKGDAWGRPSDDRRGFQGNRERGFQGNREGGFQGSREGGFLGNRVFHRSSSRERW